MRRRRSGLLVAVVSVLAGCAILGSRIATAQRRPAADTRPADLIVTNGSVYQADGGSFSQAVAVRGNRIALVGTNDEVNRLRGANTEVVDAHGGAVVPGFNDVRAHMLSGGLEMDTVNLQGAQTLQDLQSRIRSYADTHRDRPASSIVPGARAEPTSASPSKRLSTITRAGRHSPRSTTR